MILLQIVVSVAALAVLVFSGWLFDQVLRASAGPTTPDKWRRTRRDRRDRRAEPTEWITRA